MRRAWYALFIVVRALVTLFFVLTCAYSVLNYSPFVFHQFIRPRIFWWVDQFVAWHHVWYVAAYVLSVTTVLPDVIRRNSLAPPPVLTRSLALAYIVVFGLVAEWLVVTPYLPKLWNDGRSFVAALLSFVPIVWLAVIDHVAGWPAGLRDTAGTRGDSETASVQSRARTRASDQRRLLVACLATAGNLWIVHLLWAWLRTRGDAGPAALSLFAALWALSLSVVAAMLLYIVLNAVIAVARATRSPRASEYVMTAALAGAGIAAVLMTIVFPTIAFGAWEPLTVSLVAGSALAFAWSGVALRRPRRPAEIGGGIDRLIAPLSPRTTLAGATVLVLLPLATGAALAAVERADWNFLLQKTIVVAEWVLTFGVVFGLTRQLARRRWSFGRLVTPPLAAAVSLTLLVGLGPYVMARSAGPGTEPDVVLDRYAGADQSFRLLYDTLVAHPGRDGTFNRYLQMNSSVSTRLELTPPDVRFSSPLAPAAGPRPHIFLFVIDSLRRDYLSPFNTGVTFTPHIAKFAAGNFAYQNAFTRYGGTALAVPALWTGGLLLHRPYTPHFERSDALEKLLDADGYRWYMSLDTHMAPLLQPRPDLVQLDGDRGVMQFDFCRTVGELETRLDARTDDRPVFAFTLPQNLHISNRQHGPVPPGEDYPGFFEPYAAEVHRIDECFGRFLSYLQARGLYDDSIVILTTDHGDSLGEGGNWGHSVTLYPEVVRIPLLVHLPERLKAQVSTDLTRLTFSTDIVPTLYALLGHKTESLGPLFGSPLFVPPDVHLAPRDDGAFLLASSYAATYGMLRDNGRSLYIADLVNGREYAYDMSEDPLGARVAVTDELRNVNQRLMREQVGAVGALYNYVAEP